MPGAPKRPARRNPNNVHTRVIKIIEKIKPQTAKKQLANTELDIRRKPILSKVSMDAIKKIILEARAEVSKISNNEVFNSGYIAGKLIQHGIKPETLRDAGYSYGEIKVIFGKYCDKAIFFKIK